VLDIRRVTWHLLHDTYEADHLVPPSSPASSRVVGGWSFLSWQVRINRSTRSCRSVKVFISGSLLLEQ
jgi:hypothetical protein